MGPRLDRRRNETLHWVKPVIACQIKFAEWTRDDWLRQPVFLGIREDKNATMKDIAAGR
jgi:bifunctional non-homologous end joining protein LigD